MTPRERLAKMSAELPPIKCGGCTACCKQDTIVLGPDDLLTKYKWHSEYFAGQVRKVLDRKEDGSCVYLTPTGCGIYGEAPGICRRFDCRVLYHVTPLERRTFRAQQSPQMIHVYAAGLQRLQALEA